MTANQAPKVNTVKAFGRHIHISPQKLRLVADMVRKTRVDQALEQLRFSPRKAAKPLAKVINSAIANAVHNFDLNRDDLFVKSVMIDAGPVLKKLFPRAQGRGFLQRKRTSHISVLLEAKPGSKKSARKIFQSQSTAHKHEQQSSDQPTVQTKDNVEGEKPKTRTAPKSDEKVKKHLVDLKRRLFNRKSGT